jgi:hypothetical protein
LTYQVLDYCDFFCDDEACVKVLRQPGGDMVSKDPRQLNFPGSVGGSFDQWKAAVENEPKLAGCALAPVRTIQQLDYYNSIVPPSRTLLGVVLANPMDAYDCERAHVRQEREEVAPGRCFDGWINIVDGSSVPKEKKLWADGDDIEGQPRPNRGTIANLDGRRNYQQGEGDNRLVGMYDECNPVTASGGQEKQRCNLFPNALVECCTNPTCYSSAPEEHRGDIKIGHHG